ASPGSARSATSTHSPRSKSWRWSTEGVGTDRFWYASCASTAAVSVELRGLLGGRYRLAEPIADGGMGRVYRAHDELLDRAVAVKLIAEPALEASSMVEARAAARLSHPGIVQVFDVGVQDGAGYIVMELVPGRCLRDVLRERGSLPTELAAELASQVADAMKTCQWLSSAPVVRCLSSESRR